jgi:ABC-2 type transport system ATP-binding protein
MDEAEKLSDEVAIIDNGKIIAIDAPRELVAGLNKEHVIQFTVEPGVSGEIFSQLHKVGAVSMANGNVVLYTADVKECLI